MSISTLLQTSIDLKVFQAMPSNSIVLLPDSPVFTIVAATNNYYATSGRSKDSLINIGMFEAFPGPPDDPEHKGVKELRASLEKVMRQKLPDRMPLVRYDIENADGSFDERYWSAVNEPVVGENGEVQYIIHSAEEMTFQVKAEHSAHKIKSLEKSYDLFMQAPVAIGIAKGSNYIIELANDGLLEVWGLAAEDVLGKPLFDAVPNLKGQGFKELLDRVCETGEAFYGYGHPVRLKRNGQEELFYFDFVYKPLYADGEKKPLGVFTVGHNVTEQVAARKKIEESENRFRLMADASPAMIWTLDAEGNSTYYNKTATDFTGHTEKELKDGKTWQTAIHPDDIAYASRVVNHAVQNRQPYQMECRMRRADGEWRWLLSHGVPRLDENDQLLGYAGSSVDITERKMAEAASTFRQALLEAQNEAVPDAILVVDTKGKMLSFNRHFATLWSIPQEIKEAKDDTAALQFAMTQVADPQGFIDRVTYCYAHPEERAREEVIFKDGRIIERYGNPVVGEDGTKYGWIWFFRDITESRKTQEALAYQKQLLETVTQNTDMALFLMDVNQYCVYMNDRAEQMTGFNLEELKGKQLHYYVHHTHPDGSHYPLEECPIDQALPTQKRMKGEEVFVHKNGTFYPVAFTASPINIDGKAIGTVIEVRDTTDEKKKEQIIRESEELFRTFSNNIQSLAWIADSEGWIHWYNQRWYDYTGTTLEEMQGWGWEKVHHPDHIESVVAFVRDAWKKPEAWELIFPLRGADGLYRWFLTRAVPIVDADGKITRWIGTNTNINEQKLAQQKIEESEAELTELANAMPQLVWIADGVGNVTYYNDRLAEFAGATKDDDGKWRWEGLVHEDDLQKTADAWSGAINAGTLYQVEHRIQMKDGNYRWYLSRGIPQKDSAGNITKWFGTATDIHEQKQFTERLEQLVKERTKALQQSNDDLQQFAHVASHDLKEPVRKIRTFTSRLEGELQDILNERGKLYLDKVQKATERMFVMIDGVLTYSTLNASKQAMQTVDLNEVIKSIETDLEVLIQQTGTQIFYHDLPSIEGSSVLLYQLFYNLTNNAIKFARSAVSPVISIGSSIVNKDNQKFIKVIFNDNGIGFEQEQAEKIFETFTRLHSKDKYEGTGLGLSLCKRIVDRHGGSIEARARPDEGATFIILLPSKQTSLGI